MKYAEVLLSFAAPKANYTADSIKRMLGGEEKQIDFQNQIPVHVTYQTAFVDPSGKPQFRDDVYGLDAKADVGPQGQRAAGRGRGIERPTPISSRRRSRARGCEAWLAAAVVARHSACSTGFFAKTG